MLIKVKKAIGKYNMPLENSDIMVGLSGGADSVALLMALIDLKKEYNFTIRALHVNHNLRGDEAKRDENFVVELCETYNIPLIVESVDILSISNKSGESIELCARRIRYELFEKHSKGLIATAHNANDNAETIIFNLCRGTGTRGLGGIPPVRDNIIRPLIYCSRDDILQYLADKNQTYVNDSSNDSDDYTRNKIRHNIIPLLKDINPAVLTAFCRTSLISNEDSDFLDKTSAQIFERIANGIHLSYDLKNQPAAIRKRVLSIYYSGLGFELDYYHIEEMDKVVLGTISKTSLPNGFLFHTVKDGFVAEKAFKSYEFSISGTLSDITLPCGEFLSVTPQKFEKLKNVYNLLFKFSIDCDKIIGNVTVRNRRSGDKYRPVARNVTKTIKKLISDKKPTFAMKESLFVIEDDAGIIFTNLFGIDERVKVTNDSKNILVFQSH